MYAGEVVDGQTVRAIVGTAEWAEQNLGGKWHDSESKIPVPGTWDETNGFQPLPYVDVPLIDIDGLGQASEPPPSPDLPDAG
jgi:hypothetical protein